MLLVDAVKSRLGPVEIWPSSTLTITFAFYPHMPFSLSKLETVIEFFFGDGVALQMACQFFAACNGHPLELVKKQFGYLYEIWSQPERRSPVEKKSIIIYEREDTNTSTVPYV